MLDKRHCLFASVLLVVVGGCASTNEQKKAARFHAARDAAQMRAVPTDAPEEAPPSILPETHLAAARMFEARGQVQKAIHQYRKVIAVNHSNVTAYRRLGLLLSMTGQRDPALAAFRRAVRLAPRDATTRNNLGFELVLNKQWREAERELLRAIELRPGFPRAYVNLGIVRSRLGRFDDALANFMAVLPEPDAYYNLGLLLRGQQRYSDARDAFEYVLEQNSDFTAAAKQRDEVVARMASVAKSEASMAERRSTFTSANLKDASSTAQSRRSLARIRPAAQDPRFLNEDENWDGAFPESDAMVGRVRVADASGSFSPENSVLREFKARQLTHKIPRTSPRERPTEMRKKNRGIKGTDATDASSHSESRMATIPSINWPEVGPFCSMPQMMEPVVEVPMVGPFSRADDRVDLASMIEVAENEINCLHGDTDRLASLETFADIFGMSVTESFADPVVSWSEAEAVEYTRMPSPLPGGARQLFASSARSYSFDDVSDAEPCEEFLLIDGQWVDAIGSSDGRTEDRAMDDWLSEMFRDDVDSPSDSGSPFTDSFVSLIGPTSPADAPLLPLCESIIPAVELRREMMATAVSVDVDERAELRELETQLAMVRNEVDCLDKPFGGTLATSIPSRRRARSSGARVDLGPIGLPSRFRDEMVGPPSILDPGYMARARAARAATTRDREGRLVSTRKRAKSSKRKTRKHDRGEIERGVDRKQAPANRREAKPARKQKNRKRPKYEPMSRSDASKKMDELLARVIEGFTTGKTPGLSKSEDPMEILFDMFDAEKPAVMGDRPKAAASARGKSPGDATTAEADRMRGTYGHERRPLPD